MSLSVAHVVSDGRLLAANVQAPPAPVPTAPAFQPPALQPSLLDFVTGKPVAECCKLLHTDKLLRPPFAGAPIDTPKGLAAKIRAEELDVKNRVRAARYLGTVDCVAYPEAQEMLIEVLHNDKWEPVRYEAAKALGVMLSRGQSCRDQRILRRDRARRKDICRGCCNADVMKALAKTAYDVDEQCCPFEPSRRVREAAVEALSQCPCAEYVPQQVAPDREIPPMPDREVPPTQDREVPPNVPPTEGAILVPPKPLDSSVSTEATPLPSANVAESSSEQKQAAETLLPPLASLNGYCVVSLKSKNFVKADPQITAVYKNRIYQFSTAEAKASFEQNPDRFCVQYAGADPVHYLQTGEVAEGRYLREHGDRFYFFVTKENWETFKASPGTFVVADDQSEQKTVQPASAARGNE